MWGGQTQLHIHPGLGILSSPILREEAIIPEPKQIIYELSMPRFHHLKMGLSTQLVVHFIFPFPSFALPFLHTPKRLSTS
jgi:hypothetical protein